MIFGGDTLQDFAFALLVGVISGAYSSIFIATPVLVHWKERETMWKRRARSAAAEHGGHLEAYADAPKAALVDNVPTGPVRLSSDQPDAVSAEEFEAMVRDLGIEEQAAARSSRSAGKPTAAAPAETVDPNDPASVRRAEARRRREQRRNRTEGDA
jgi:SecD/SecF fusion protein